MDKKKRMMFILDKDYYFITIKLLIILNYLNCYKDKFIDYRKLAFIIEFIKDDKDIDLYKKNIRRSIDLNIFERERLINIYCNGNIDQPLIKRVLLFLEKKGLINLEKNIRFNCIDVGLVKNENLDEILSLENLYNDIEKVKNIYDEFTSLRSIKYKLFIERIFGDSEVAKWEC